MTRALNPRGTRDKSRFPNAPHPLTDNEVESLYGRYIKASVEDMARTVDPFVAMAESANQILSHRERPEARKRAAQAASRSAEAQREAVTA